MAILILAMHSGQISISIKGFENIYRLVVIEAQTPGFWILIFWTRATLYENPVCNVASVALQTTASVHRVTTAEWPILDTTPHSLHSAPSLGRVTSTRIIKAKCGIIIHTSPFIHLSLYLTQLLIVLYKDIRWISFLVVP